jgi:hypothetical protein
MYHGSLLREVHILISIVATPGVTLSPCCRILLLHWLAICVLAAPPRVGCCRDVIDFPVVLAEPEFGKTLVRLDAEEVADRSRPLAPSWRRHVFTVQFQPNLPHHTSHLGDPKPIDCVTLFVFHKTETDILTGCDTPFPA